MQDRLKSAGRMPRRVFLAAASAMLLAASGAAAQTYPTKPVTMVVPFAAGGPTDIVARVISERLSQILGQQFIVENVAGAAGTTGAARVARAAGDGYTLLMGPMSTMSFSPALYPNAGFNPLTDLEPVGIVASAPMLLAASNRVPGTTLADFTKHAKDPATKLNNGNAGVGSTSHLACVLLNNRIGIAPTMVPYRGTGPAIQDLVAGNVDYICDQVTSLVGSVQGGSVKAVAMLAPTRSPLMPNVPTAAEAGLPGVEMVVWNAVFASKGTPAGVIARLNNAIGQALNDPATGDRFRQLGAEAPPSNQRSPEALARTHASDIQKWSDVIKGANISVSN